jgi:hypothetical protein
MTGFAAPGSSETFLGADVDGVVGDRQERLTVSWFSTLGELDQVRTDEGDPRQRFRMPEPFEALPASRTGGLYLVMRDGRGGADFLSRPLLVCEPLAPAPTLDAVEPATASPGAQVVIRGAGLADALDVRLGDRFLEGGFDPSTGSWVATIPGDATAGSSALTVRGRQCAADPHISLQVTSP